MRTLISFGLGALAMYFFDPYQGRRRRAQLRGQYEQFQRLDLPTRARGAVAEVRRKVSTQLKSQKAAAAQTPESAHHLGR